MELLFTVLEEAALVTDEDELLLLLLLLLEPRVVSLVTDMA